ncbi:DUF2785 domain-containing protein [Pontibacillus yanchengensis]|uniref:DUF2785 domain-containing protein n=1 Tax=Pontibacillus yanchengensis Y32 TaxID=1385514 RepID=A0A0A2TB77_9BACI|nr:DUF2785 domain-containing protein [Pontibacillus yanchengensis]KGP71301.1 hypothetical protein N782_20145 [Pontibacillus yanchengensis Y32]
MEDRLNVKDTLYSFHANSGCYSEETNMYTLIEQMLHHIGSTDAELRDNLIYSTFGNFIMGEALTIQQIEYVMHTCLREDFLFFRIGENEGDGVFTRSFSSLVIALILEKDRATYYLPRQLANRAILQSIQYLYKEQDVRGYVDQKGWAHSIAHGADLLEASIRHPLFELELAESCLESIEACLFKGKVYIDDEDERLLIAMEALIDRGLDEKVLTDWISTISIRLQQLEKQEGHTISFFRQKTNVMNFLKSLYFRLMSEQVSSLPMNKTREIVDLWHTKIYG